MLLDGVRAHGNGLRARRAGLVADRDLLLFFRRWLLGWGLFLPFLFLFRRDFLRGLLVVGRSPGVRSCGGFRRASLLGVRWRAVSGGVGGGARVRSGKRRRGWGGGPHRRA